MLGCPSGLCPIGFVGADPCVCPPLTGLSLRTLQTNQGEHMGSPLQNQNLSHHPIVLTHSFRQGALILNIARTNRFANKLISYDPAFNIMAGTALRCRLKRHFLIDLPHAFHVKRRLKIFVVMARLAVFNDDFIALWGRIFTTKSLYYFRSI